MYQATIIKLDFDLCEECETCPCLCNEDQEENEDVLISFASYIFVR